MNTQDAMNSTEKNIKCLIVVIILDTSLYKAKEIQLYFNKVVLYLLMHCPDNVKDLSMSNTN